MLKQRDIAFMVTLTVLFFIMIYSCGKIHTIPAKDMPIETRCAAISMVIELGLTPILKNNPDLIPAFKVASDSALVALNQETTELRREEANSLFDNLVLAAGSDIGAAATMRRLLHTARSMFILPEEAEVLREEAIQYMRSVMDGVHYAVINSGN